MSQGCALLILRSKGQRSRSWRMVIWKWFPDDTDSVINLWSWNFIHLLTMSQGCALLILRSKGQRSRSWRMVIWKWFPDDNWLCNQPMIMKLHTLTHHESRMHPIDFEVQRSRSWRMVIWKWFPDDNWLCNQPMIMKLHTLTHHESRMRPIDFEVKRSRSWRMVIWKWSTEIMVADLNLLGSVGDLYCFSNTFSMLLYVAPICCPSCLKMVSGR